MSLKGHRFRYFGLPSLQKAIEVVFHELLFEVFNPCRERNPRVIFLAESCGKAIHPVAKSGSPDRFETGRPFLMKPRVLIVDGHSIIFQWPDLTLQHAKRTAVARESLVRMLTGLQDNTDWHVTVVSMATESNRQKISGPHGIQVFYSTADQTADSVIERLAAKYSDRYEVTVATNDFMERAQSVATFGATSMSRLAASGGNRNGGTQSRRAPQTIAPALSAR
jgi:predicted RNA-binding protein with PIN domain